VEDGKLSYHPLYLQVKDVLMKRIVDGVHAPGELIPSESRLAAEFGTSISTIRQALSLLVAEDILVKKQGKGTIVSERKVKLTFLSWMGETRRGEEILGSLVKSFEDRFPPISIDIIPTTYPETRGTLTRLIAGGRAPDVAQIVSHWTSFFASSGAFQPLEGLLSAENISGRLPGQDLFGGTYQDRLYSVAWGLCPISLVANRTVMKRAGIGTLESPMTLSRFQECCRRIDAIGGTDAPDAFGLWYTPGVETDYLSIYAILLAFNGEFIDDKGALKFDSPENASGFTWLRKFVADTKIFTSDIFTIRKRFADNRIGFIFDGPWITYLMEEITGEPLEKNFQVLLNPVQATADSRSWTYNHALAICSQSRNKLHAARFVEALTGDPELSAWYCSRVGILPPHGHLRADPRFSCGQFATFREQLRHTRAIDARNPMFERAMVLCVDAVRRILFEGVAIQDELTEKERYLRMLYYD
jgi:ABC-type glycerol-3-phosphate transport system substrate-binding protein